MARCVNFHLFSPGFVPGLFHLTKDLNMQRVTYIYNGETQTFYFNFPYIEKSNIVVTVDGKPAPAYNVIGVKGGLNPDFPFSSGRIVFVKPLKMFQTITIERHLQYKRPVDFQPTAKITPIDLNFDMNNTLELLKDLKDEVDDLREKYENITDSEKIDTLLEKIKIVNQTIANVSEKIDEMSDIFDLPDEVNELQELFANLNNDLSELEGTVGPIQTKTSEINDYIVDKQDPNAENNYTWYRKYHSGWVEIGGTVFRGSGTSGTVTLPITMLNNSYTIVSNTDNDAANNYFRVSNKTTTSFVWYKSSTNIAGDWIVTGYIG